MLNAEYTLFTKGRALTRHTTAGITTVIRQFKSWRRQRFRHFLKCEVPKWWSRRELADGVDVLGRPSQAKLFLFSLAHLCSCAAILHTELIGQLLNHVVLLGYCFTSNHKFDHFQALKKVTFSKLKSDQ